MHEIIVHSWISPLVFCAWKTQTIWWKKPHRLLSIWIASKKSFHTNEVFLFHKRECFEFFSVTLQWLILSFKVFMEIIHVQWCIFLFTNFESFCDLNRYSVNYKVLMSGCTSFFYLLFLTNILSLWFDFKCITVYDLHKRI